MNRRGATRPAVPPQAAYAPALGAGFQALTARVQEIHQAVAGTTFDQLLRVPGLSVPTRIAQGVHDAIAQGVYAAIRQGGGALGALAGDAERLASDPQRVPGPKEQALRSAVNGAFGDALVASGSALALPMSLHAHGAPLPVGRAALAALRPRVAVFIHGLACDEQSWRLRTDAWQSSPWADALGPGRAIDCGALLEHELGISAIAVRYNTGLAIDANADELAALLDRAAAAAPQVREWILIGHSMGGLVARRAHERARLRKRPWARRAPLIVCLGSPHQGAPLEKLAHAATAALNLTSVTQPLGRIAASRSRGIQDLRHGLARAPRRTAASAPALRLVFGTLGDEGGGIAATLVGHLLGDGLVRADSGADAGAGGDVERVELAGLGHMALLNHPRVYALLRRWLEVPARA